MNQAMSYTIAAKEKSKLAILMVIMIAVCIVLEALWVCRVPIVVFIGFGLFFYFTGISTATLTGNNLSVKPALGRARVFAIDDGEFDVKTQTGLVAYLSSVKSEAKVLIYTKQGGKPVMVLNGLYQADDIDALYAEIQKRKAA